MVLERFVQQAHLAVMLSTYFWPYRVASPSPWGVEVPPPGLGETGAAPQAAQRRTVLSHAAAYTGVINNLCAQADDQISLSSRWVHPLSYAATRQRYPLLF